MDFCETRHGKVVRLVQVAYEMSEKKTRKRELASLLGAARKLRCDDLWLVTNDTTETLHDGDLTVRIVAARDWLGARHLGDERFAAEKE